MKFALYFISFLGAVFRKNCTARSQSELRNFFMYITNFKTVEIFHKTYLMSLS